MGALSHFIIVTFHKGNVMCMDILLQLKKITSTDLVHKFKYKQMTHSDHEGPVIVLVAWQHTL